MDGWDPVEPWFNAPVLGTKSEDLESCSLCLLYSLAPHCKMWCSSRTNHGTIVILFILTTFENITPQNVVSLKDQSQTVPYLYAVIPQGPSLMPSIKCLP